MLTLIADPTGRKRFPVKHYWFASQPRKRHALTAAIYFQCQSNRECPGFQRQQFCTSLIKVSCTDHQLLNSFSKGTRYEIKRAHKDFPEPPIETISFSQEPTLINAYPSQRAYAHVTATRIFNHPSGTAITHTYLLDSTASRVRLLASNSGHVKIQEKNLRDEIARCNRLLHYLDMLYFREMNFNAYDFGGISRGGRGSKLGNIDQFKLGFRGPVIEESMYISLPIVLYNKLVHKRPTRV